MGASSALSVQSQGCSPDQVGPDGPRQQSMCLFHRGLYKLMILISIILGSEGAEDVAETEPEEVARLRHEAVLRRQPVVGAPPLDTQAPPTRQCQLPFGPRWLLFLFIIMTSLSWSPMIQEQRAVLAGEIDIELTSHGLMPIAAAVKETGIAARDITAVYQPAEESVVSRLLEVLYGVCAPD
ncbi:hypothetical protein RhiJN_05864 [Ceratobasidium sp. AG-Ba]|nr:hypothetical protein RhiJN_05864 [Ceratobasidium sp. AG-Ba]QRW06793.1 hypothetical protein RhiLY_05792 [Ceratobasidium sp. AG-Ba]